LFSGFSFLSFFFFSFFFFSFFFLFMFFNFIYEPCNYTRVIGSGEVEGLDVVEEVCRPKVIYCVCYGFLVV